jgi:hypothetical protein
MADALVKDIGGLIGSWQPRKAYHIYPTYLEDLKKFIREGLKPAGGFFAGKRTSVELIDGKGMDIGVKRRAGSAVESVGIVMKRDLLTLADLKVLMEQINQAEKEYPDLFVILIGTQTADMENKLAAFLGNKGAGAKITIVKK